MEPRFFKKENNSDHAAEFKRCLPVNVNTSYTTLAPAIATVEEQRIKPVLGAALYAEAADYYETYGTAGDSEAMNRLVELIQMATVRLAYWDSFDQLAVMMSDSGLSDKNGDNRVYRYQADALKASLLRQGNAYLNQVIGHCMAHLEELWKFEQSEYYSERKESVIRTMEEMERVVPIGGDFGLFARLRGYIGETEEMELPYRVGAAMSGLLRTRREEERVRRLLRAAQGFVAHWAMAEAVPLLNMTMTASGPQVESESATKSDSGRVSNPPTEEQTAALQRRHREMAERYIGQLVTYCKQHAEEYPEIGEIGTKADHEKNAAHRANRGKRTFLA